MVEGCNAEERKFVYLLLYFFQVDHWINVQCGNTQYHVSERQLYRHKIYLVIIEKDEY